MEMLSRRMPTACLMQGPALHPGAAVEIVLGRFSCMYAGCETMATFESAQATLQTGQRNGHISAKQAGVVNITTCLGCAANS